MSSLSADGFSSNPKTYLEITIPLGSGLGEISRIYANATFYYVEKNENRQREIYFNFSSKKQLKTAIQICHSNHEAILYLKSEFSPWRILAEHKILHYKHRSILVKDKARQRDRWMTAAWRIP